MLKFRLSTALWVFTLACLLLLVVVERSRHQDEVELLNGRIQTLNQQLTTASRFGSNYPDLDIYIPSNATGRIDDTMIYTYTQNKKSPKTLDQPEP